MRVTVRERIRVENINLAEDPLLPFLPVTGGMPVGNMPKVVLFEGWKDACVGVDMLV
jgi:hypothetical protein